MASLREAANVMRPAYQESFNDKRLDEASRPLFDRCMELALKMIASPTASLDRLHAIAHLADAAAGGFDERSKKGDEARDDLCRRVFGAAALAAKEVLDGKGIGGSERVEALAELMDAACCGFEESEEDEIPDEYDMTGGM